MYTSAHCIFPSSARRIALPRAVFLSLSPLPRQPGTHFAAGVSSVPNAPPLFPCEPVAASIFYFLVQSVFVWLSFATYQSFSPTRALFPAHSYSFLSPASWAFIPATPKDICNAPQVRERLSAAVAIARRRFTRYQHKALLLFLMSVALLRTNSPYAASASATPPPLSHRHIHIAVKPFPSAHL